MSEVRRCFDDLSATRSIVYFCVYSCWCVVFLCNHEICHNPKSIWFGYFCVFIWLFDFHLLKLKKKSNISQSRLVPCYWLKVWTFRSECNHKHISEACDRTDISNNSRLTSYNNLNMFSHIISQCKTFANHWHVIESHCNVLQFDIWLK